MPPYPDIDSYRKTAAVLARNVPHGDLDAVRATLEFLHHSDRPLTPDSLRECAPSDISRTDAENIVYRLDAEGILTDEYLDQHALDTAFAFAVFLATEEDPPENELVATIPYEEAALDQADYGPLLTRTLDLIRAADDRLVLMSPFLSERAFDKLRPALRSTAQQDTRIVLITRYLTYGGDDGEYNRAFVECVLDDPKIKHAVEVHEYVDNDTWTTFHAKLVVADDAAAYLGTANLTHKGFHGNLELGVVFRDDTAARLSHLADALLDSEFLHPVGLSGGRFSRLD